MGLWNYLFGKDENVEKTVENKPTKKKSEMIDYHFDRDSRILTLEFTDKTIKYRKHGATTYREVRELKSAADYIKDEPAGNTLHLNDLYDTCREHKKFTPVLTPEEIKLKNRSKNIKNILDNK